MEPLEALGPVRDVESLLAKKWTRNHNLGNPNHQRYPQQDQQRQSDRGAYRGGRDVGADFTRKDRTLLGLPDRTTSTNEYVSGRRILCNSEIACIGCGKDTADVIVDVHDFECTPAEKVNDVLISAGCIEGLHSEVYAHLVEYLATKGARHMNVAADIIEKAGKPDIAT
ncbi:uncharacterized protein LY79DRAFT_654675 [Colletotrichum navitas]|uniref:Uncharacterized protein n=1 Tax=Colletotrichum navitas TaxID=681940 RepID=A0AAD8QCU1_9PEZI|nr:uncharacterized protein LY79DRAFT_654675 [Colletotrichum navitas]KAK1600165.1 hypothetical protein LY79DRAFT_654675 [Colletotrichum navitas]